MSCNSCNKPHDTQPIPKTDNINKGIQLNPQKPIPKIDNINKRIQLSPQKNPPQKNPSQKNPTIGETFAKIFNDFKNEKKSTRVNFITPEVSALYIWNRYDIDWTKLANSVSIAYKNGKTDATIIIEPKPNVKKLSTMGPIPFFNIQKYPSSQVAVSTAINNVCLYLGCQVLMSFRQQLPNNQSKITSVLLNNPNMIMRERQKQQSYQWEMRNYSCPSISNSIHSK